MRILQVTNRIPWPLNDGGAIATYNVTRYLHRLGHHVVMASLNTNKHHQDPKAITEVAEIRTVDINTDVTPGGALRGLVAKVPYNVQRFWSDRFEALLEQLLQEQTFDIIQLEGLHLSLYLPVLRKFSKAKIILRAHNVEHQIWQRLARNERNFPKRLYLTRLAQQLKRYEREQSCRYDGIAAITEPDAAWFRQQCPGVAVEAVPAGVELHPFPPLRADEEARSICMLGSLEWQPNVQGLHWFLDEVWPLVRQQLPEVTLHVAGKNPSPELLVLQVPQVKMHGQVPRAIDFLLQHPVLVVPLRSGGGMRLKVVEAMGLGRCVVSTPVGAEGIEATDGRHLLLADAPAAFAAALVRVLTDGPLREQISREAAAFAQNHYSWQQLIRKLEAFYRSLA